MIVILYLFVRRFSNPQMIFKSHEFHLHSQFVRWFLTSAHFTSVIYHYFTVNVSLFQISSRRSLFLFPRSFHYESRGKFHEGLERKVVDWTFKYLRFPTSGLGNGAFVMEIRVLTPVPGLHKCRGFFERKGQPFEGTGCDVNPRSKNRTLSQ